MRLHWSKWLAFVAAIGLVGLAVISYQRFFVGECFLTRNSWYQVIVRDGNLGLIRVSASFLDVRPADFELEEYILGWRRMPIAGNWRFLNRVTNPTPNINLRENEINCTMYAVATLPLWIVYVAMPCWRNRWRALPLLREIIWPSDRPIEPWPYRRKTKRLAIAMAFLVLGMSVFFWTFDYPLQPAKSIQFTNTGVPTRLTMPGFPGPIDDATETGWQLYSLDGSLRIRYVSNLDEGTQQTGWIVERFGFRLTYRYDWAVSIRGRFTNATFAGSGLSIPNTLETSITFPLWPLIVVCLLIIVVSFLRGPWRRHKCLIENCCLRCGYNLTGLIEPRCPECGTSFSISNQA